MRRLFTRPWWGRIWVLQEIALPKYAEFVCGTQRISRSRCSAAIDAYLALWRILVQRSWEDRLLFTTYQNSIFLSSFYIKAKIMLYSWRIYRYGQFGLAALLRATCVGSINLRRHGPHHLESTDPRDKIFALLSLAADREDLKNRGVFPNYTKPCAEIYASTMAALLEQGHMALLSMCQNPRLQSGLPSWVPDWSRSVTNMLQDIKSDHITIYPTFNAGGGKCCHLYINVKRVNGLVKGISSLGSLYDKIEAVGRFYRRTSNEVPLSETFSWPREWLIEILRLTYHNKEYFGNFHDRLCAAARTSIGGVGYDGDKEFIRIRNDDRLLDAMVILKDSMRFITDGYLRRDVQRFLADKAADKASQETSIIKTRLGSEIIGKSLGRIPFVTTKGNLGLSSEHVRQGDIVAVIKGNQVPFIFRHQPSGLYQLISEAYVEDIMDGEAAERSEFQMLELA